MLLEHLAVNGAQTIGELVQRPPALLMLQLNELELRVAVDSCRRHRLIEPLDPNVRQFDRAEWALTDLGRKGARSPYGGLADHLAQLIQVIIVAGTVLFGLLAAATGLDLNLSSIDRSAAVALLVLAVMAGQLLVAVMNDRRYRVSRAQMASEWERLARERPLMRYLHTHKRRVLWPGVAALVAGQVLVLLDQEPGALTIVLVGLSCTAFLATQARMVRMTNAATREALDAMQAQIDAMRAAAATRPEPQAPPQRESAPA